MKVLPVHLPIKLNQIFGAVISWQKVDFDLIRASLTNIKFELYTPDMLIFSARKLSAMTFLKAAIALAVTLAVVHFYGTPFASAAGVNFYVSTTGSDTNPGTDSAKPFKTIQKAIDNAQPGDVINLSSGTYMQDFITKRNGEQSLPITIKGSSTAIVKGGGNGRIIEINHDYIILQGFTVDGLFGSSSSSSGYRDKLIYFQGKEAKAGVKGAKVLNMSLKNAGGECVRFRYFAENNEVSGNTITNCGVFDFKFSGGGKNGEGVYIGTAPEQLADGKNPTTDRDLSNNNWVHHNTFNTQGNECVDIKEASSGNIIENNKCTGQKDSNSAGLDSRGNDNIFRSNESYGNRGAGIRIGGDTSRDGAGNHIYKNNIYNNASGGIKFMRTPQGQVCSNTFSGNTVGDSMGTYGSSYTPTTACTSAIDSLPTYPYPVVTPNPLPTPTATPIPLPSISPIPSPILGSTIPFPAPTSETTLKVFVTQMISFLQTYLSMLP